MNEKDFENYIIHQFYETIEEYVGRATNGFDPIYDSKDIEDYATMNAKHLFEKAVSNFLNDYTRE